MSKNVMIPMPPSNADGRSVWAYLEEGMHWIMAHPGQSMPASKFMNLYTVAYNYAVRNVNKGRGPGEQVQANLIGSDLYNSLVRFFVSYLTQIYKASESMTGQTLLLYYADEWERYNASVEDANRLFSCLSRHGHRRQGRQEAYRINSLALVLWKLNFFLPVQKQPNNLTFAIIKFIESERDGKNINRALLKQVLDTFISVGLEELDTSHGSLELYQKEFETPFIEATETYYKIESGEFLARNPLVDYLRWAETRLKEEEDRVVFYLHPSTSGPLVRKCEVVLIQERSEPMTNAFQQLLDLRMGDDLQRMFLLLARVSQTQGPLSAITGIFEQHVKRKGIEAISNLVRAREDVDSLGPKVYVDALLGVYDESRHRVNEVFKGDWRFTAALDKACRSFVNNNAVTEKSTRKHPEILATYVDGLLRRSNPYMLTEGERDKALRKAADLIKYISEMDTFQTAYTKRLAKRLIDDTSVSPDAETFMLQNLKYLSGYLKMAKMLSDMECSRHMVQQFEELPINPAFEIINFDIKVIGHYWDIDASQCEFVIPRQLLPIHDHFTRFYMNKYSESSRKLTWLWGYSKNELRTHYLNQRYLLETNTQQMAILMQFNTKEAFSLEELVDNTGIPEELLTSMLAQLVTTKILTNEETRRYDLNPNFQSKKIRVNLNATKEETASIQRIGKDRQWHLSTKAYWIVKRRGPIKNQALIAEVVSQISEIFTPTMAEVKRAIESLIEREYIERSANQPDTYIHLP